MLTLPQKGFLSSLLFFLILFFFTDNLFGQPPNDSWANASEISIGNGGFERGAFQSDTVDVIDATNEFGEYLANPSYPKSVWYKFTIPTHRVVNIKVMQPTQALISTAAGFVVYEETASMPTADDLAVFTPLYSFASYSENVCLQAGTYYIQVVTKNNSTDNVFVENVYVEIDIAHTYDVSHSEPKDQIDLKYNFGTLNATQSATIHWNCTSIDSEAERAHITGSDSLDYNKSLWVKFTTDDHIDLFYYRLGYYAQWGVYHVQIWEGDLDSADVGNVDPVYQEAITNAHADHYLTCILDTNTTYTMQIVAHESVTHNQSLRIGHFGEGEVTGAYPQESDFHPNNQIGMINPEPDPGVAISSYDYFSCAAQLSNDSIVCGSVNPPDTAFIGDYYYGLTTWFTFSTAAESNTKIATSLSRAYGNIGADHYMGFRIYNQTTDNDCINYNYPADIYFEGGFPASGFIRLLCLPPGDYAIQLLGRQTTFVDGSNMYAHSVHLGSKVNITITSESVPELMFGLDAPGEVDWINDGNPLTESVTYTADSAYFSCTKTVLPDTAICEPQVDRAIYREVIIGDADGDALPDSGMLVISGLSAYSIALNQASNSPFYKGDASALAAAQSNYSWPGLLTDLEPYDGCNMYNTNRSTGYPHYYPFDYGMKKYCVTPGTYTLANVGDSIENGLQIRPSFRFEKTVTQFSNPDAPEDLGDIIAQGLSVTSQNDYFSCLDNPDTIAGYSPCGGYTKQLYREFYISEPCRLFVNNYSASHPWSYMRVFSGRVSQDGINGLTLAPFHSSGCYSGHSNSNFSTPVCSSVPEGWYTVVSYGFGPNYDNNYDFHEDHLYSNYGGNGLYSIDKFDRISVSVDTSITPGPFYNRPYKACNQPDTVKYVNTGSEDFPSAGTSYTFCQEYFSAQTDTPMVNLPINACNNAVRLAYYVFTTDDEYYAKIGGVSGYYSELYELDVRQDSTLFPDTDPLISCESYPDNMAVCRLQPGTYTLVVYGTASQQCVHFQPNIYVAPVEKSRFDWAATAYDFGLIPPDNTAYGGAVGDVHPTNSAYLPSNDFVYCGTGASATDPGVACGLPYDAEIYPDSINNAYFFDPGNNYELQRRNLWYTFVLQGTGYATVQVRNHTNDWTPGFTVFRSDMDGTIPFSSLIGTADLDSTAAQGLTFVKNNLNNGWYCYQNKPETIGFQYFQDPCVVDSAYRRYYVLVEAKRGTPLQMQVDMQVKWNPIEANPQDPVYDYFYEANVLGAGETAPPYSNTPLLTDSLYTGGWGNLSCATTDTTDNALNNCGSLKTLWYKVILDQPGFLYLGRETDDINPTMRLLAQVNAPDSIVSSNGINGLQNFGDGSNTNLNNGYPDAYWRYYCVEAGVYYVNLFTCNAVDTSEVRLHAYFREKIGNNCTNAPFVEAPSLGEYSLSDPVQCHSIGADFGEDGSDMGCLLGPSGFRSSWFKFSYTGSDLVDILFQLNLGSLSSYGGPAQVRYRLFYGEDCDSMIEGAECSVNAYINNSVACVSEAEGDFYVQVTYPASASGTLGFKFTVSENTNPDCNPFTPSLLTSDFVYQMNCDGDSLIFSNYSTSGSNLDYFWDFGQGGNTSTAINPVFAYPDTGSYTVSLSVINPANQDTVTSSQNVHFEIGVSPLELGDDQVICLGETAVLGGFIPQASYSWSTSESVPEIGVQAAGDYFLDLTVNGCTYSDTVGVEVIDLSLDLGADVEICLDDTAGFAYQGEANPEYLWSTGVTDSSLTVTQTGTYWLELNQGDCTKADTVEVLVHDLTFDLGNDTTICAETSYYHHPNLSPGLTYNWSTGSTADSVLIAVADTFALEVGYAGCTATSQMTVSVLELELELGADTTICIGESLLLSPQTNTAVDYLWNDGSTNSTLSVADSGWYSVDVEALACHSVDSILVNVLDLGFELPADTTICFGDSLTIDPQLSYGLNYSWNTGDSSQTVLTDTAGVFELTVDSIGCSAQSDIEVNILNLTFSLGPDSIICDGASIVLSPDTSIGETYLWSDSSVASQLTVDTTGVYGLEIGKDGCSAGDEMAVTVFYVNAQLADSLTACLNDTTLLAVSGADSLIWNSGQSAITEIDDLNFNFYPQATGTYLWTAYEDGCEQSGSFDFEVVQPYIPEPDYDAVYCRNELVIIPPEIDFTSGTFSLDGTAITAVDIATQGSGDFEILYAYVDTNTCAYSILLDYSIVDTTTISFNETFDPMCVDADPLELAPYLSDGWGETNVRYDLTNWIADTAFHTDSLQQNITSPLAVPIRYTYVNTDNCQSRIEDEIVVHPLPDVAFSVNPICAGDTAVFSNNSSVNGSAIASELWTFQGNGSFSGSLPTEVSYSSAGFYPITLEVTSDIACVALFTDTLEVMALPVITADAFGPFCLNEGDIGLPTMTPVDGDFTYNNDLISAFDTYELGSGSHEFTYAYTDSNGCYNDLTSYITVNDTTSISFNETFDPICVDADPLELAPYLSDGWGETSVRYDLTNWTADTAFHTDSLQQNIISPLAVSIRYTYVNADNCQSIIEDEITIHPLPIADFSINATCVGDTVVFTNNSSVNGSSLSSQVWSFENNGTFSGSVPENISFDTAGSYAIELEITSIIGCEQSMTDTLEIMPLPELTTSDFGPFCLNDGDVNTPEVSPAGGEFTMDEIPISTFDTYDIGSGVHTYVYTFTDGNGCYNEIAGEVTVNDTTTIAYNAPFEPVCIDGVPFDLVPFMSHPDGQTFVQYDLTNWTADSVFHIENVNQDILNPVAIPVHFTYSNAFSCESSLTQTVLVHPLPVISVIVPNLCTNEMLSITNNSYVNGSTIESINWNIEAQGEFDSYDLEPMSFDEPDTLGYSINISSSIGCYSADTSTFKIFTVPQTDFTWTGSCDNVPVEFTSGSTIASGQLSGYTWIMDGNANPGSSPGFENLFETYGTHEAGLIAISDNGCTDTLYQSLYINPAPLGGMIVEDHCLGEATSLIPDVTIPEGEIVQIDWIASNAFGVSSLEAFTHTFASHGLYTINQVLTSASGCSSIYSDELRVYPLPDMSFVALSDSVCSGNMSTLLSTSSIAAPSEIASTEWSIDRIRNFTGDTIDFAVYNPGWIPVEITGISDFGCVSTHAENEAVKVLPKPEGFFVFDSNPVRISDPDVSITDLSSQYVDEWMYSMGDGTVYWDQYPTHTYEEAGEYRVEQLVINKFGCSDTTYRVLRVEGFIIYVPNAFSPNNDGINDIFKPSVHGEEIENYKFQIWDRYGAVVFESIDLSKGWNGSSMNSEFLTDNTLYTYYLLVQGKTGNTYETRGSVVIVR